MNTDEDHVHLQIEIPPNIAVSDAVGKLKAASSRHLRTKFKFIREIYLEKDGIWSVGYFSSTVGLNESQVKRYIQWQSRKDCHRRHACSESHAELETPGVSPGRRSFFKKSRLFLLLR